MNPKITITVDAKNKAIAAFDGIASVGAKVDVEVRGLPSGIVDFGAGDDWSGPSLRFRILDDDGNDIVRFPLEKKTSTTVSGGDQWTKTTVSGADTYTNKAGTVVDFDTDGLREQFVGEAYDTSKSFGIILDSAVDKAEFAVGKIKIRQWLTASVDDPTVLPNWTEIQEKLNTVDAKVEKPVGSTTATITITNTQGVTTTATVSDGIGGGDMKHSEFASVMTLSNATLNQVAEKVNELIGLLKPAAMPMIMAMFGMCAFGDIGPTTQFGDVPPTSTLRQVVTAGGGGGGGANTNAVRSLIDASFVGGTNAVNTALGSYVTKDVTNGLCTVAAAEAMTNAMEGTGGSRIVRGEKSGNTWMITAQVAQNAYNVAWQDVSNKPTTLSGYGITDAYTKTDADAKFLTKSGPNNQSISYNEYGPQIDFNANISRFSKFAVVTEPSKLAFGDIQYSLPIYLDSLEWRTTGNRTLEDYGIANAYTKTQIDGTSVTNLGAVAASQAMTNGVKAYADATFRSKEDVLVYPSLWEHGELPSGYTLTESQPVFIEEFNSWKWFGTKDDYGPVPVTFSCDAGSQATTLMFRDNNDQSKSFVAFKDKLAKVSQLPSTNGFVTVDYANATFATKLTGRTYDFANGSNFTKRVYTALTNVIQTLGGTVMNPPAF